MDTAVRKSYFPEYGEILVDGVIHQMAGALLAMAKAKRRRMDLAEAVHLCRISGWKPETGMPGALSLDSALTVGRLPTSYMSWQMGSWNYLVGWLRARPGKAACLITERTILVAEGVSDDAFGEEARVDFGRSVQGWPKIPREMNLAELGTYFSVSLGWPLAIIYSRP